jgi:predicted NBD/HSP70 family sugar kinase
MVIAFTYPDLLDRRDHMSAGASGSHVLRRINTATVLDAVRLAAPAPLRISQLAATTGLARPTVAQAVEDLLEDGWLVQHSAPSTSRGVGRPAVRFSLASRAAPVVGVDVGARTVTVAVADLTGAQLSMVRRTGQPSGADQILRTLESVLSEALEQADVRPDQVAAVTVGSPGLVDTGRDAITLAPGVPGWSSVHLVERLHALVQCDVRLENDANLAALGISATRDAAQTLLAVQWGERIGSGVIIEGRLHRGRSGAAGEIGFVTPPGQPRRVAADQKGPLEVLIGAEGIVQRASRAAAEHPASGLAQRFERAESGARAAALFEAAADGDEVASAVVNDVAEIFACAIAPVVLAIDPDAVVIGGGIARAGEQLPEAIERHLKELTLTTPSVELSPLAQDSVVTGALQVALADVWAGLLPERVRRLL